jgi:membrane-associated phospholipid phosphatase
MMRFLTDFADQAVVLPLIATVALMLAVLGWRRGALAWLAAIGMSFAAVLALKLVFATCGPALGLATLRSPSGHAAAAAATAGGVAVALGRGRWAVLAGAGLGALLIGLTRISLGFHTPVEAALGGTLGVLGALAFAWLAGTPPPLRLRWLFTAVVAVALLLHGRHLDAEPRIRAVAFGLSVCHAMGMDSQVGLDDGAGSGDRAGLGDQVGLDSQRRAGGQVRP